MKLGSFQIKKSDQQYIDILKGYCEDVVGTNGKDRCNAPFMRRFVSLLWNKADDWKDVSKFHRLLHECSNAIRYICKSGNALPDGDESFRAWFDDMVREINATYTYQKPITEEMLFSE